MISEAEAAAIREWLVRFPGFQLSVDGRIVQFVNGKKFWAWDSSSLTSFVAGVTYQRVASPGAAVPNEKPADVKSAVDMVSIEVPASVAERVLVIATALHNQMALSTYCNYSFPTLATAIFRCRRILTNDEFSVLLEMTEDSNLAKHNALCCDDVRLPLILEEPRHGAMIQCGNGNTNNQSSDLLMPECPVFVPGAAMHLCAHWGLAAQAWPMSSTAAEDVAAAINEEPMMGTGDDCPMTVDDDCHADDGVSSAGRSVADPWFLHTIFLAWRRVLTSICFDNRLLVAAFDSWHDSCQLMKLAEVEIAVNYWRSRLVIFTFICWNDWVFVVLPQLVHPNLPAEC